MRRITGALVVFLALAIGATAGAATFITNDETRNEQQVNAVRSSKSVQHLAHMAGLQQMARAQAVRMMERGDIYHNPNLSSDITALGVNWKMVGENVGMGPDEDTIEAALLKSPHHYENIVRPNFNNIGVGIVKGPDGTMYLVQEFAEIAPSSTSAPARKPVVAAPRRHVAPRAVRVAAVRRTAPPAPRRQPVVVGGSDPNALLGGRVVTADLPGVPQALKKQRPQAVGFFRHLLADITFWS